MPETLYPNFVKYVPLHDLVSRYVPDFCWQNPRELYHFILSTGRHLSYDSFKVNICKWHKKGLLQRILARERPRYCHEPRARYLYKKVCK